MTHCVFLGITSRWNDHMSPTQQKSFRFPPYLSNGTLSSSARRQRFLRISPKPNVNEVALRDVVNRARCMAEKRLKAAWWRFLGANRSCLESDKKLKNHQILILWYHMYYFLLLLVGSGIILAVVVVLRRKIQRNPTMRKPKKWYFLTAFKPFDLPSFLESFLKSSTK